MHETLCVEVAYAKPEQQMILTVDIAANSTALDAIIASAIQEHFPEIDLNHNKIGIFGKVCALTQMLKQGDRVEIYRPLQADPRDARRNRLQQQRETAKL